MIAFANQNSAEKDAIDGSYRLINIGQGDFTDYDDNFNITVVQDSWYYEGEFPGTILDYKNYIFYSPDFNATQEAIFSIHMTIADSMGVETKTFITIAIVPDYDSIEWTDGS